jgi:hypothetical protein
MRALASPEALVTKRSKPEPSENRSRLDCLDTDLHRSLVSLMNMLDWTNISSPQYTTDGSNTVNFPSDLKTWLSIVNMNKAAFNTFSQVNS